MRVVVFTPAIAASAFLLVAGVTAAVSGAAPQGLALCLGAFAAGCMAWWALGADGGADG